jgi:hypothetical protein
MAIVGKIADLQGIVFAFSLILLFPLLNIFIILCKWGKGQKA